MNSTYKKNKKQKSNVGIIFLFFLITLGGMAIYFYPQNKNKTLEKLNSTIEEYINLEKNIQQQNEQIKNHIKNKLSQLINEINQYELPESSKTRDLRKLDKTFKKIITLSKELRSQWISIDISVQTPTIMDPTLLTNELKKIRDNLAKWKYDKKYYFADEDWGIVLSWTKETDISKINNSFISTPQKIKNNNDNITTTNNNDDNNNLKNTTNNNDLKKDDINNNNNLKEDNTNLNFNKSKNELQILNKINDLWLSDKQIEILKKLSNQ